MRKSRFMKGISNCLLEKIQKYQERQGLKSRDFVWDMTIGNCYGGFPPSFYQRHTPQEIEEIRERTRKEIQEMIERTL